MGTVVSILDRSQTRKHSQDHTWEVAGGVRKFTVLTTACTSATFYITIAYTVKKHKHVDEKFGGYLNELGKSYCYDS